MKEIPKQELVDLFEPREGGVNMYYGRIGNGKTYSATADILELLSQGRVVYANWHINFEGFDERNSLKHTFFKFMFGRKLYFKFPVENLHYFSPDDVDIEFLSNITDAEIFVDEGQWLFDSYEGTKFSKAKRKLILHTRHLNRSLNIISQRTQAIQVSARGQVNRFYKCEKKMSWPFLIFRRTEYQDMKDNDVDENNPASSKTYFASKFVMNAYNSKYLRGGVERSQEVYFSAFEYKFKERGLLLLHVLKRFLPLKRKKSLERTLEIKSLGVESKVATIKNGERLNTVPVGVKAPLQDALPF